MSELKAKLKANLKPAPVARTADILRPVTANSPSPTNSAPTAPQPTAGSTTRTTLELPADLHTHLRYTAIDTGTSLNAIVTQAVARYLDTLDEHTQPPLPAPSGNATTTRVVTVRIDTELHRRLRRTAFAHNTSMSALTAAALSSAATHRTDTLT